MLGIYSPTSQGFGNVSQTDDELDAKLDSEDNVVSEKGNWLKPLRICAHVISASLPTPTAVITDSASAFTFENVAGSNKLITDSFKCDVPIWIEMMNRSERSRQLAYVVRVLVDDSLTRDDDMWPRLAPPLYGCVQARSCLNPTPQNELTWDENVGKMPWLRRRTMSSSTMRL